MKKITCIVVCLRETKGTLDQVLTVITVIVASILHGAAAWCLVIDTGTETWVTTTGTKICTFQVTKPVLGRYLQRHRSLNVTISDFPRTLCGGVADTSCDLWPTRTFGLCATRTFRFPVTQMSSKLPWALKFAYVNKCRSPSTSSRHDVVEHFNRYR
jgi:hypothetical protein